MTFSKQGELVQFLSAGDAKINSCKVYFSPKQAGTGDPSPENVRAISGYNGVEVYHCGKNIANLNSDKMLSYSWTRAFPNPFKKAGKYTISCQNQIIASGRTAAYVFLGNAVTDGNGYGLTAWTFGGSVMSVTFNITEAALSNKYIIFRFNGNPTYNSIANAKIQIEEGTTATKYEPYTGTTYSLDWTSEVGTVYGGYVDLVSGELVETHRLATVSGSSNGSNGSGYNGTLGTNRYFTLSPSAGVTYSKSFDALCDKAKKEQYAIWGTPDSHIWSFTINSNTQLHVVFDNETVGITSEDAAATRTEKIKSWLAENPMTFVIPRATPITHQLTPSQLTTLTNQNTFWSNADRIEIEYDLIETRQIEMARRNIIMNSPHIESVTGSNASFITDMAGNLKECKIHFTPIQEGSGDPSPENVRPIHGWDGVTVNLTGKNLFDASGEYLNNKWINNNGEIVDSLNNRPTLLYTQKIPVVSGTDYTIHGACNNIQYIRIVYYDENDNFLGRVVSDGKPNPSKKFTPITGTAYVLVNPDTAIQNIQLEKGSSATTYEPYTAQSLIIPFPQTIYGGYVDLVKGEVVEEWVANDMGIFTWDRAWNAFCCRPTGIAMHSGPRTTVKVLSEIYKSGRVAPATGVSVNKTIQGRNGYEHTCIEDSDYNAVVSDFKEGITGYKMAYTLATPNTYSLDPVTIRTLRGLNNIFSSANGNIEITYWTH